MILRYFLYIYTHFYSVFFCFFLISDQTLSVSAYSNFFNQVVLCLPQGCTVPIDDLMSGFLPEQSVADAGSVYYVVSQRERRNVILPKPFNELHAVFDGKAKGAAIMVALSSTWEVTVFKCSPNIRLIANGHDAKLSSAFFMQCPNVEHSSVGFVCVAMIKQNANCQKRNAFQKLRDGFVTDTCFLCISQGVYHCSRTGESYVLLHKLKVQTSSERLAEVMERFAWDDYGFVCQVFDQKPITVKLNDVSLVYLNQIAGPFLRTWNLSQATYHENGVPFLEARLQPDVWCNKYINNLSHIHPFIQLPPSTWRQHCKLLPKQHVKKVCKKRKNIGKQLLIGRKCIGMQRLTLRHKNETDIFICKQREPTPKYTIDPITGKKSQIKFQLFEYLTALDSPFVIAAPLTIEQCDHMDRVFKEFTHLSKEEYNSILNDLLRETSQEKMVFIRHTLMKTTTDSFIVSLLPAGESMPTGTGITSVSSRVSKMTIPNNKFGALDVKHGTPVQWGYSWPFEPILNNTACKFIMDTLPIGSTKRYCTSHTGRYQNLGTRSTNMANGSMMVSPYNTAGHHYCHSGMNKTALPHMIQIKNQLRDEAMQVTLHLGELFVPALQKVNTSTDFSQILAGFVCTWKGYANFIHRDEKDEMFPEESSSVLELLSKSGISECAEYIDTLFRVFPKMNKLPMPSTCGWCLVEENEEYHHRQFFANVTCGTVLDISSSAYNKNVPHIGSTFYGGLIEHCTMRPLWIRNDGMVRLSIPCGTDNYNMAWGDHEVTRKAKRDETRRKKQREQRLNRFRMAREQCL